MKHIACLSGGADSTAMALWMRENWPTLDVEYVCTPTGDELPDMKAHWERLGMLLGRPLTYLAHPMGLRGLIEAQKALPNHRARWCTRILKIETAEFYYYKNLPCTTYVGLRADEEDREGGVYADIPELTQRYPLREIGWNRSDVEAYLDKRGVCVPARTDCARCYDQRLYEWWNLWKNHPAIWADAEAQEAMTKHTFRSPSRDTWPAALKDLRARFERGDKPRGVAEDGTIPAHRCRVCRI